MQGMSSCTSEYTWIISSAQAARASEAASAPNSAPLAYTSNGRTRLPPPSAV